MLKDNHILSFQKIMKWTFASSLHFNAMRLWCFSISTKEVIVYLFMYHMWMLLPILKSNQTINKGLHFEVTWIQSSINSQWEGSLKNLLWKMKNVTFKWQVRNANALVTTKTPRPSSRAFLSVEDNFLCHWETVFMIVPEEKS